MLSRIFWLVLDSFGVGNAPDAARYGDSGSNTAQACLRTGRLHLPNLARLGLFHIPGATPPNGVPDSAPLAAWGRMCERSAGKDTTCGHWELAGVVSEQPLPTYPNGFPQALLDEFSARTGRAVLCNRPYSGTQVIRDFGQAHEQTGALIVYTSADSVFQIAAHEAVVPVETLYRYCEIARELLTGEHGVGRVIARPFTGSFPDYTRTSNRRDFSLLPPRPTVLDAIKTAGRDCIGVGKIHDIFAGQGLTRTLHTLSNEDGMAQTIALAKAGFSGLCFVNLVDFDMKYGHRNDSDGYADALNRFDEQLGELMALLGEEDGILITADHGCDPSTPSTDHSREQVPLLCYGKGFRPVPLGDRLTFADLGATVAELLGAKFTGDGVSFAAYLCGEIPQDYPALARTAIAARAGAYVPYSHFRVGAALLGASGRVYPGGNIENASYSVCNCAERTALFAAASAGELRFSALAVAGGPEDAETLDECTPCGVCRQAFSEFCPAGMPVVLAKSPSDYVVCTLAELLPRSFGADDLHTN